MTRDEAVREFLRAVSAGEVETVQAALAAEPELVNAVGPHPFWGGRVQALHVAIESNRPELVTLLLEVGAEPNGQNEDYEHWSPLMLAAVKGTAAMRAELVRWGAQVGLIEALLLEDDRPVMALEAIPASLPHQHILLHYARTTTAIDKLLSLGAETATEDRWGTTLMGAMSRLGRKGQHLVRHLIERGIAAGPEEYARLGERPPGLEHPAGGGVLLAAVDFGHLDLVTWLLDQGADPNGRAVAQSRQTALHSAAWNGDLAMVEVLLDRGADPTLLDEEHASTPLDWAQFAIKIQDHPTLPAVIAYLEARTGTDR